MSVARAGACGHGARCAATATRVHAITRGGAVLMDVIGEADHVEHSTRVEASG
jgi:hypothetical protein